MMTKPLTRRLWLETAERARSMLNARPQYGEKLVLQRAAADRLGLKMTTLRTYLDGLAAIEEVEKADRALGANLRTRSVDAVRAIGRWMRNDRASALGFVRDNPAFSAADVARAAKATAQLGQREQTSLWNEIQQQVNALP